MFVKKSFFSFPLFFFIFLLILFTWIKLQNISISLSDTNEYFYFGKILLQGKVLYKDFLHADLPLFPYMCALYFFITHGNLLNFYRTAIIEVLGTTIFIFLLVKNQTKAYLPAIFSSCVFLFSGFVMQLSDFQEGVFTTIFFGIVGYYFYTKQKNFLSGIFLGLAVSTKLYAAPMLLGITILTYYEQGIKKTFQLIAVYTLTSLVILLPFLVTEFGNVYRGIFAYSLHRPEGSDKMVLFGALIYFNAFLMLSGLYSLWTLKNHFFFASIFILTLLCTFLFPDLHYLYFAAMIPFLSILSFKLIPPLSKVFSLDINVLYVSGIVLYIFIGTVTYYSTFAQFEKVSFMPAMLTLIKQENPKFLYGLDQLNPAISYESGVPLLDGIIDTNENMFRKGVINKTIETKHAIANKTLVISYGLDYPNQHTHVIVSPDIIDVPIFLKSCTLLKEFSVFGEGQINTITLSKCY